MRNEKERKKGKRKEDGKVRRAVKARGASPDTEVSAAGVVASDRSDSARVGADVARPGLGDVEGAVCVQADARGGLDVDEDALFLPDMPGTQSAHHQFKDTICTCTTF